MTSHTSLHRHFAAAGLAGLVTISALLAGCVGHDESSDNESASSTAESSPTGTSESPDVSPSPTGNPHSSSPRMPSSQDANDPGDGVARDTAAPAPTQTSSDGRVQVSVVMTRWGAGRPFEAGGIVTDANDADGTCTLTLSQGAVSLTATGHSTSGPTGASCGDGLRIDDPRLTPGSWQATLAYSSARHIGVSAEQEITLS